MMVLAYDRSLNFPLVVFLNFLRKRESLKARISHPCLATPSLYLSDGMAAGLYW